LPSPGAPLSEAGAPLLLAKAPLAARRISENSAKSLMVTLPLKFKDRPGGGEISISSIKDRARGAVATGV
jgi:hypothetical protein